MRSKSSSSSFASKASILFFVLRLFNKSVLLIHASSADTVQWYGENDNNGHNHGELTWSTFNETIQDLDHCFLYLDAPRSIYRKMSSKLIDDLFKKLDGPMNQTTFPHARIIHVQYYSWWPEQPEFLEWWEQQLQTPIQWGKNRSFLFHVQQGQVSSALLNLFTHCKPPKSSMGDDDEVSQSADCILYLFSFDLNDEDNAGGNKVDIPYSQRRRLAFNKSTTTTLFEGISKSHEMGDFIVAEYRLDGLTLRQGVPNSLPETEL
jgi:hypothetical protein